MKCAGVALGILAVLMSAGPAPGAGRNQTAQGFGALEKQVREFSLPNGIRFIVLERHDVPIFSFRTYVNAGDADAVTGITGIAHMFEHMAFKGTPHVGTSDWTSEEPAIRTIDRAYAALMQERHKRRMADSTRLAELSKALKAAQEDADRYVVSNEFSKVVEREGATDLNAFTGTDFTQYLYDLPSNKLELWALMEGDRLAYPVLREFYKERDVVIEERRERYESSPSGRLFEDFLLTAFVAHPYGNGLIGHRSDLESFSREQAQRFYEQHYVAKNMVVVVVGDVSTPEVERLAGKYFSGVSDAPVPPPVDTVEPPQRGERRVVIEEDAQPFIFVGNHIPDVNDPRYHAYEALADILGSGRSSRLYTRLVKEKKLAVNIGMEPGMPGEKYPNLMFTYVVPASGVDPDSALAEMDASIARLLRDSPVTQEELDGFKTRARARFWRGIGSNQGMAGQLAYFQGMMGDWRRLFRQVDEINAVTADDVMRAARECLRKENRTVAILRKSSGSSS